MDFQGLADAVDAHPEGPTGLRAMTTFSSLISSADIGMKKKIKAVTAGVGVKMKVRFMVSGMINVSCVRTTIA